MNVTNLGVVEGSGSHSPGCHHLLADLHLQRLVVTATSVESQLLVSRSLTVEQLHVMHQGLVPGRDDRLKLGKNQTLLAL